MTTILGVQDVARYFLAKQNDSDISNMKLQKLCYYAQGVSLALRGQPLWTGFRIKAWKDGPVIPPVYHEFKAYSWHPIPRVEDLDETRYDDASKEILDMVFASFGRLDATRLSKMTHEETPWTEAFERHTQGGDDTIPNAALGAFFKQPTGPAAEVLASAVWSHIRAADPGWDMASQRGHEEIAAGKGLSLGELRSRRGL